MCVNKSVPAMAGARLVIVTTLVIIYLEIGARIAPATIPKSNPNAPPTPIKAIPTALVVHELPVMERAYYHGGWQEYCRT
jgi:hypothetical protein